MSLTCFNIIIILFLGIIVYQISNTQLNTYDFYNDFNSDVESDSDQEDIPLDAVITYVNNKDPNWKTTRNMYPKNILETVNARKLWRFQDSDEIYYCLKCIEKNAPFFRNIYITISSNSQRCDISHLSLKTQYKIRFVLHEDFFYNTSHLPTFNSMSIEANLHNISELSEYFVYFNDDCFINKPITKDFFVKNGKINVYTEETFEGPRGTPNPEESGFFSAWKNTNKMLDTLTKNKSRRLAIQHIPQIQIKSIHKELYSLFPIEFRLTSQSKFRNTLCNLTSAGLCEYYSHFKGLANLNTAQKNYIQVFLKEPRYDLINKLRNYTFVNVQTAADNVDLSSFYSVLFS